MLVVEKLNYYVETIDLSTVLNIVNCYGNIECDFM